VLPLGVPGQPVTAPRSGRSMGTWNGQASLLRHVLRAWVDITVAVAAVGVTLIADGHGRDNHGGLEMHVPRPDARELLQLALEHWFLQLTSAAQMPRGGDCNRLGVTFTTSLMIVRVLAAWRYVMPKHENSGQLSEAIYPANVHAPTTRHSETASTTDCCCLPPAAAVLDQLARAISATWRRCTSKALPRVKPQPLTYIGPLLPAP
jgi:hypothetical protein